MTCNRRDCPDPGPHVHLRWQDEHAIASVLLEEHFRRQAAKARAKARAELRRKIDEELRRADAR